MDTVTTLKNILRVCGGTSSAQHEVFELQQKERSGQELNFKMAIATKLQATSTQNNRDGQRWSKIRRNYCVVGNRRKTLEKTGERMKFFFQSAISSKIAYTASCQHQSWSEGQNWSCEHLQIPPPPWGICTLICGTEQRIKRTCYVRAVTASNIQHTLQWQIQTCRARKGGEGEQSYVYMTESQAVSCHTKRRLHNNLCWLAPFSWKSWVCHDTTIFQVPPIQQLPWLRIYEYKSTTVPVTVVGQVIWSSVPWPRVESSNLRWVCKTKEKESTAIENINRASSDFL